MSRRLAARILGVAAIVGLAAFAGWRFLGGRPGVPEAAKPAVPAEIQTPLSVTLYFPGDGDRLYREPREVLAADETASRIRATVEALLGGPRSPGLRPVLPAAVTVGAVFFGPGAVAYVDLRSEAAAPPSGGSLQESLTVYALVNSVLYNVADAKGVVWLWNGTQLESFGGHLDATRPFTAHGEWIAPAP